MYDWSEGGDTEVVVEDIERLNMDFFDKYDKQQQDWRMQKEVSWPRVLFIIIHWAFIEFSPIAHFLSSQN